MYVRASGKSRKMMEIGETGTKALPSARNAAFFSGAGRNCLRKRTEQSTSNFPTTEIIFGH